MSSMSKSVLSIGTLLTLTLSACTAPLKEGGQPIAKAYGEVLYLDEVAGLVGNSLTKADSQAIINRKVNNWLMDEILFREAKSNLGKDTDLEALVNSYKKSLYISTYESALATDQNFNISEAELDTFYYQNQDEFILNDNLLQCLYIKVPEALYNKDLTTLWETENLPALRSYLNQDKGIQLLDTERWHTEAELKAFMPEGLQNKINFSSTAAYSHREGGYYFKVKILETAAKGKMAPLSYARPMIYERLNYDKASAFIKQWKKDLYQNKIQGKDIQVNNDY